MTTSHVHGERTVVEVETAGSVIEAGAGVAVIALAIIGLARGDNGFVTAIAAIVLGAALFAQGGAIAAQYSKLVDLISGGAIGAIELGGGMGSDIIAGAAVVVLGILGLIGFSPGILLASAVIAAGATLLLGSASIERLAMFRASAAGLSEMATKLTQATVASAVTAQVLTGCGAIVLGIIALAMPAHAIALTLIALLALGGSIMVTGAALTGRLMQFFER
ncbi:MAG TPA: hypothetical protein VMF11_02345 [Candidatus Baltobacteraceae bacterium]|nr:hypothetical protein [Candidatus Baltobacteraceae bacterium]